MELHGDVFEDFVEVTSQPSRPHLTYAMELHGAAAIREVEGVIELLDADGAPRLRMVPPSLVTRAGVRRRVGAEIVGCTVDRDPAPPWGRPHPPPGSSTCTLHISWNAEGSEYPLWVDPAWVAGPNMIAPRSMHHAVRLDDGRVLVVGGQRVIDPGAELYDPATDSFATVAGGRLHGAFFTATKLSDGRVVAIGGSDFATHVRSGAIDVYDPKVGVFVAQEGFPVGRAGHSANLLQDDRILVAGGFTSLDVTAEAWTYAPGAGLSRARSLPEPRGHQSAVTLADGRVLLTGGERCCDTLGFAALASTVIYDPRGDAWTSGPQLVQARYDHSADRLPDGTVVIAGGATQVFEKGILDGIEIISPTLGSSTPVGAMGFARSSHRTAPLPNGRILAVGTFGPDFLPTFVRLTESIDAARGVVTPIAGLIEPRSGATVTALTDGRFLVTGGGAVDRGSRTTETLGARYGEPCGEGCVGGACVQGTCCPTAAPCATDGGQPTADASPPDAAAGAGSPPIEAAGGAAEPTSYHACATIDGPTSTIGALAWLLVVGARRRRRIGRGVCLPR